MQPDITNQLTPPSQHHTVRWIVVTVIVAACLAVAGFFIVQHVQHANLENDVKTELMKQNNAIRASASNNVYKQTLPPQVASTNKVHINAVVSTTGTSYCIDATSTSDAKVVYHMNEKTAADAPATGSCADNVTAVPSVPGDASIASTGTDYVTMQWNASIYAMGYSAQCATNESFTSGMKIQATTHTSVDVQGLNNGTLYYCRVAATNPAGQSEWSKVVQAQTALSSKAPTNVKANIVSSTELSYAWDATPGAQYYLLQYTTDINFVNNVTTIKVNGTSGSVTGLQPYTGYYFHVAAITANFSPAQAAYSEPAFARTKH